MPYLDHAATTPMTAEAVAAMQAELVQVGNASSLHTAGRRARRVVEESREAIAAALGARPSEVVFTSGGTEADNLAVQGMFFARRDADGRRRVLVTSAVEHHAVLDTATALAARHGAEVVLLGVDAAGRVDPGELADLLARRGEEVALVSVMWANNEVGTVQPVAELAAVAHEFGVPLHTDAVQAVGQLPVDFTAAGVDAMTVTAHKHGGPIGAGALVIARDAPCVPVLHGGGQEREVRSGTLDTPGIAGFAAAATAATRQAPERARRLAELRDGLVRGVLAAVPDALLNGDPSLRLDRRLPGNAHFSFPGAEGDSLLLLLDAHGIECSTGSACSAGVARPSHVLLAMGHPPERARGSLRFSFGHTSHAADVAAVTDVIASVVQRARLAGARAG